MILSPSETFTINPLAYKNAYGRSLASAESACYGQIRNQGSRFTNGGKDHVTMTSCGRLADGPDNSFQH